MKKEFYPVLRGLLLRVLYASHPDALNLLEIQQALDDLRCTVSQDLIRSECDYLKWRITGRSLVVCEELSIPGSEAKLFTARLTAHGVDLVEKRMAVPDADQNWIKL